MNNNNQETFRSSIYQMLFSYLLRCICYVVGHSLNPSQMKRLSFITNNFIHHDIISFNSLLKNETKNPFSSMESDNRIKKRTRKVENITRTNKSSTQHSSYTEVIDPETHQELYDYKKMYYDLMVIKNNQEEEVVRLLKREKELLEDKAYWKNKYLKLVEDKTKLIKSTGGGSYLQNVTITNSPGAVINADKDTPIFNSPDIDVSVNKQDNRVYNQTYDNQTHNKTVNDNKTINTTKIINKDDKQLKNDLKSLIFQEFEKLDVQIKSVKNKNLGAGTSEKSEFHEISTIPSYQADKISKLQNIISDITRDEKSVIGTLTYNQTKFYHFLNGLIVNDNVRWTDLENLNSWIDKFRNEFLSHLFDENHEYDISFFCQSVLNAKKKYCHKELKLIVLSIDDTYLNYFFGSNLYNVFFKTIELAVQARKVDSYKKSLLIKSYMNTNKNFFNSYVDVFLSNKEELRKFDRNIVLDEPKEEKPLPYTPILSTGFKTDLNPDNFWKDGNSYMEHDWNYDHGHNLPFHYNIKSNIDKFL